MAKKRRKKTSEAGVITAEFGHEDAKGGGGRNPRLPEGDYVAKIIDAKQAEAKSSGNQMIVWTFKILEGKYKGKKLTGRTTLVPKALFMLRDLLEALGKEVPEKTVKVNYKECIGEKIGISLEDEEYENKPTTEVNGFLDADMVGAEDEDDEDEDDDALDDDDEDDDDEADLDDMDRDELKAYIKENDLGVKVKKSWDEDDIREAIGEAEDDDDDEDDDMEEVDLDEL